MDIKPTKITLDHLHRLQQIDETRSWSFQFPASSEVDLGKMSMSKFSDFRFKRLIIRA